MRGWARRPVSQHSGLATPRFGSAGQPAAELGGSGLPEFPHHRHLPGAGRWFGRHYFAVRGGIRGRASRQAPVRSGQHDGGWVRKPAAPVPGSSAGCLSIRLDADPSPALKGTLSPSDGERERARWLLNFTRKQRSQLIDVSLQADYGLSSGTSCRNLVSPSLNSETTSWWYRAGAGDAV